MLADLRFGITAKENFRNKTNAEDHPDLKGADFYEVVVVNGGGPIIEFRERVGRVIDCENLMILLLDPAWKYTLSQPEPLQLVPPSELLKHPRPKNHRGSKFESCVIAAAALLPRSESTKFSLVSHDEKSLHDISCMVVKYRLIHPICSSCEEKSTVAEFILCPECRCTWYCNSGCLAKDKPRHQSWCAKPNATIDLGPSRTPSTLTQLCSE